MTTSVEPVWRGAITHAALSAGIAFSWTAMSDSTSAQQPAVPLDPIDVSGQTPDGESLQPGLTLPPGSFNTLTASSPKLTAPLLDTPQTVTVIPQAIIREQGARTLTEVLRNTPGISFDSGENGFGTSTNNFKLRGFDSSANIFVDGARDSGSYTRDMFNVERVEVFKGAASDNGRGGPGGYVNMVTKTPLMENFLAGEVSYGWDQYASKPRKRATADANYIIAPHTAFRLNAVLEESGIAGREVAEMNPRGFAPSIAFGLGTNARAVFAYEHLRRKDLPDWGVPGATIPGLATYFQSNGVAAGAPRDAVYGLRSDLDHTTSDSFTARFEYDLAKDVTISNQTRWSNVDRFARYTVPTGLNVVTLDANSQTQFYERSNTTLTNLTNLSAKFHTGAFRHSVSMGLEYTSEDSDSKRFGTFNRTPTNVFDPDPDRDGAIFPPATQRAGVKINTIAAYLYDTIELNRHWEISGGLRAERYKVDLSSTDALTGAPLLPIDGYQDRQTTLGGKIGIVYKPVENGSIYAAYSVNHQPPGSFLSNPDISRTGDNAFPGFVPGVKPVRADNYEVGIKWDFFDKKLSTAVALFQTVKSNVPITGRDVGETVTTFKGYGEQEVRGIELSIAGELAEGWNVFGGVAFMSSERKLSPQLDEARRRANPADYIGYDGTVYCCTDGNSLSFTPDVTASLWTTYLIPTTKVTIGGGLQYVSWSWVGRPDDALRIIPNGVYGTLPGYTIFNAMVSYEMWKDVHLRFNIDNITNETYAASTNWPTSRAQLGAPRTYRVSANFKF